MVDARGPSDPPRRRVILLGASNLARGVSMVVETARGIFPPPLEIVAAMGLGRSYGMTSSVLGRQLPGICQCGLWRALDELPPAPTAALLTDVGNDLLYEASVASAAGWVERCLDRLAREGCRVVMTGLPLESVGGISERQFRVLRGLLFPRCGLSLACLLDRANALDSRLLEMAAAREIRFIRPDRDWFGWDRIHVRRRHWAVAWRDILAAWSDEEQHPPPARGSLLRSIYLRSLPPEARRLWSFEQRRRQPSGRLSDGTTLAFY